MEIHSAPCTDLSQILQYKKTIDTSGLETVWPTLSQLSGEVCVCLYVRVYVIMRLDSRRHELPVSDIKMREEQWIIFAVLCLLYIIEDIKGPLFHMEPQLHGLAQSGDWGAKNRLQKHLREFPESPKDVEMNSEQVKGVPDVDAPQRCMRACLLHGSVCKVEFILLDI